MKSNRTGVLAPLPWLAVLLALVTLGIFASVPAASAAPNPAVAGNLTWGVIASFRTYVTGPVSQGTIAASDGATVTADGLFQFPIESGTYDSTNDAVSASFGGQVKFEGHNSATGPLLSLTITDIRVALNGATGTLVANIASKNMTTGVMVQYPNVSLAELSGAAATGSGTPVNWAGIAATLTAAAAPAFGGGYAGGQTMDTAALMLIVPPASASPTGTTTTTPLATTTPPSGDAAPSVQLSKVVVNPDGDTITVTGTGFVPTMSTGTRPPLAGKPSGVYVAFGAFPDNWKPSAGAPSASRPTLPQGDGGLRWAVLEADRATVGAGDSVTLKPDGSFVATITVKRGYAGALADGNYGIYTYPGSGAIQPLFETFTAVTFTGDPAPQPPATGSGMADTGPNPMWLILAGIAILSVSGGAVVVGARIRPERERRE